MADAGVQHPPAVSTRRMVEDAVRQTALARDLGFDIVVAGQHFLTQPYHMLQPIPLLARIAAEAGEMRVGTGVLLLTLLNPVEVAEQLATLDAIAGGRLVCGVGLGYRVEENEAFDLPARRLRVFEQICNVCWADWLKTQQQLINHYGLNLRDPQAKDFLFKQMEQFLFTPAAEL